MLHGKTAIVTGAGSGIGRATVRRFAHEGARVVAADTDLERACETCDGHPGTLALQADVTDAEAVRRLVQTAVDRFGDLDVYFNNAGIPARVRPLEDLSREEWDATLDVNLTALFIAAQIAAPPLRRTNGLLLV